MIAVTTLTLLSDTHCGHHGLASAPCDVLVHAGDWTRHGTMDEAADFMAWYGAQPATVKVLTPGNHDWVAAREPEALAALAARHGVLLLVDQPATVLGLRFWVSPYSPAHGTWAYQQERGAVSRARWSQIPDDLDVLVTHTPPHGICDRITRGDHVGCESLLEAVRERAPRLHVFGHVHESHGEARVDGLRTRFINAANFVSTSVRCAESLACRPGVVVTL